MKIKSLKIKNFRSYEEEVVIDFDDLTVLVGKNDIGKSTILEALDIFFNDGKGTIKIDKSDVNVHALSNGDNESVISICFSDLPESVIIDSDVHTTLESEYMLNSDNLLEVIKNIKVVGRHLYLSERNIRLIRSVKSCLLRRILSLNGLLKIIR